MRIAGPLLRVRNLHTGKDCLSHRELDTVVAQATARAEAAEAELAALKASLVQPGKQLSIDE